MCPLDDTLHLRGEQCHMTVSFFVLYDGGQILWECVGEREHLRTSTWCLGCSVVCWGKFPWPLLQPSFQLKQALWLYRRLSTVCPHKDRRAWESSALVSSCHNNLVMWMESCKEGWGFLLSSVLLPGGAHICSTVLLLLLLLLPVLNTYFLKTPTVWKHSWPIAKNAQAGPMGVYTLLLIIGRYSTFLFLKALVYSIFSLSVRKSVLTSLYRANIAKRIKSGSCGLMV